MLLTCLDILNIHVRLPHWSKSWYLWHAANIWCLLVSLWKQCPLLSATWPPPMWFYWERGDHSARLGGRPHGVWHCYSHETGEEVETKWGFKSLRTSDSVLLYLQETDTDSASPSDEGLFKPYLFVFNQRGRRTKSLTFWSCWIILLGLPQ